MNGASRAFTLTLCLVFFGSGAAGLMLETLWIEAAQLFIGHGVWASSLVLSAFMAGLALGGWLAARFGDRVQRPLRAYAALELSIAVTGGLLALGLPALGRAVAPWLGSLLSEPLALGAARFGLAFALFLLPSTAMGATLALLVRALVAREQAFGRALGLLYGSNTLGAVAGALATDSVLLSRFGVAGSAAFAAAVSAWAALMVLLLERNAPPTTTATATTTATTTTTTTTTATTTAAATAAATTAATPVRLLLVAFAAGLLLLALEVVWLRLLLLFLNDTPLALSAVLALVLAGIGLGSLVAGALPRLPWGPAELASVVALAAGVLGCLGYWLYPSVLQRAFTPDQDLGSVLRLAAPLVLPTSLASGALFALLGGAVRRALPLDAAAAGTLAGFNTAGAALGPLLAGLVLLPALGSEHALLVLLLGYGVLGVLLMVGSALGLTLRVAVLSVFGVACALFPLGQMEQLVRASASRWIRGEGRIVSVKEGQLATLVHVRHGLVGVAGFDQLATNAYSMTVNDFAARRYMELFVVLPAALQPRIRRALVIGYGIGNTAGALTALREVERVDVVDISSDILALARTIPGSYGRNPLRDPRTRVRIEDGRFYLASTRERYDLITGEPPPPIMAGVASLYSREYFELVRARLTQTGMATYWLPMMNISAATGRSIIAAFCEAFEDCSLWHASSRNLMLLGTADGARQPVTAERFGAQWSDAARAAELRSIGLELPGQLGALFIGDAPYLRALTEDDPPLTDDWPKRMHRPGTRAQKEALLWELRDTRAARARFAESAFVGRFFDPALRRDNLRQFENQRLLNDLLFQGPTQARQTGVLDQVLRRTELALPVVLLLDSDPDVTAALRKLPESKRHAPALAVHAAAAALVERDFATAARFLAPVPDAALPIPGLKAYVRDAAAALAVQAELQP